MIELNKVFFPNFIVWILNLNSTGIDIFNFCHEFLRLPDGTCKNRSTGAVIPHCMLGLDYDLGCHSAIPYGGITFDQYIRAARKISSSKNILVLTEDGGWVKSSLRADYKDLNIYTFSAPANHRSPSNFNGANVFATFELAQQCHGFVAHLGSAFSQLILRYMCFHHHSSEKSVFGKCPDVFDFSELH